MPRITSQREVPLLERFTFLMSSMFLALIDISIAYLGIDIVTGHELNWGLLLTAWWVLWIVHQLDFISDYKNGLI